MDLMVLLIECVAVCLLFRGKLGFRLLKLFFRKRACINVLVIYGVLRFVKSAMPDSPFSYRLCKWHDD